MYDNFSMRVGGEGQEREEVGGSEDAVSPTATTATGYNNAGQDTPVGKPDDRPTAAAAVAGTVAVMACCNTGHRRRCRISFENNQFHSDGGSVTPQSTPPPSIHRPSPASEERSRRLLLRHSAGHTAKSSGRKTREAVRQKDTGTNGSRKKKAGKARCIEKHGLQRLCSGRCASNNPSLSLRHNRFGNDRNRLI